MRKLSLVVMAAILVLALATVAMAGEPFVGTWKLNLAKSKYAICPRINKGKYLFASYEFW